MNKTSISYLTHTWNPIAMRCTRTSPACDHCWHLAMANRLSKNPMLSAEARAAYAGETGPVLLQARLDEPLRRKKPAVVGVQFMGDLWHKDVDYCDCILPVFEAAQKAPQHTYVFLSKRTDRMREFVQWHCKNRVPSRLPDNWIGMTTVENQEWADRRIFDLLETPWAIHGISAEPLLGQVNLENYLGIYYEAETVTDFDGHSFYKRSGRGLQHHDGLKLDWVIAGGETGPGARPMLPDWARGLRDQCQAARVPFHFKQWGEWAQVGTQNGEAYHWPGDDREIIDKYPRTWMNQDGLIGHGHPRSRGFCRVGNKRAGRLLDGVKWGGMPEETK